MRRGAIAPVSPVPGGFGKAGFPMSLDCGASGIPARDLAVLLRSPNPLVLCETVGEKRFESLVRAVAGELELPVSTWSAASGLSPCHPIDAPRSVDLAVALREIRSATQDGVWWLKDLQPHLENPSTRRALRETAQDFAGSARTLVLVGPTLPPKLELDDLEVRFPFDLPGPDDLRNLVGDTIRRLSHETPRTRVELSREDVDGLVSNLQVLTMFEPEQALARSALVANRVTVADSPP